MLVFLNISGIAGENPKKGHYVAYVKYFRDQWLKYNDKSLTLFDTSLSNEEGRPYRLTYVRDDMMLKYRDGQN